MGSERTVSSAASLKRCHHLYARAMIYRYCLRVAARNGVGVSGWSSVRCQVAPTVS